MNNRIRRPRLSEIEIRMILTDMKNNAYHYTNKNRLSHDEIRNKLGRLLKK